MTPDDLLDHIAIQAMQGMLAGHFAYYGHNNYWSLKALAEDAYECAEAMTDERLKRLVNRVRDKK